jgi:hypothetical protein
MRVLGMTDPVSSRSRWAGWVVTAIAILFLTFDTAVKLLRLPLALEATVKLGYRSEVVFVVGAIEAVCMVLYLIPSTSILGAVLWVGYLGGAVATHLRAGSPLVSHTLAPVVVAVLLWAGLCLRDGRARRLMREALAGGA